MSDIVDRLLHPREIVLEGKTIDYLPSHIGKEAAAEIARLRDELEKRIVAHAKLSAANAALEKGLENAKAERNKAAWDGYNHGTEWAEEYQHCAFDKCMAARDKMTAKYGPKGEQ